MFRTDIHIFRSHQWNGWDATSYLSWQRPCRYVLVCGLCDPSISTYAPHERFWGSLLATQPASTQRCSKSLVVGISSFWSLPAWSKKANDPGFIWGSIWHAYTRKTICFGERPRQTISKVLWDPLHSCPVTFSIVVRQVKQRQFWCKTFGGIHLSPAASNEHLFQLFFMHPRPCSFNPDSERKRYGRSGCVGHTTFWRATDQAIWASLWNETVTFTWDGNHCSWHHASCIGSRASTGTGWRSLWTAIDCRIKKQTESAEWVEMLNEPL